MNANSFYSKAPKGAGGSTQTYVHEGSKAPAQAEVSGLLFRKEVYQIVGCAMEVLNGLGHGLHEKPNENALVMEFRLREIPFVQQPRYDVVYKQVKVGEYIPDLVAFGAVVVDSKTIDAISDHERGRMINYLKITGYQVRVILNFKHSKLEWERIVLSRSLNSEARAKS